MTVSSAPTPLPGSEELRQEVRWLGHLLGEVIARLEGPESLELEELVRTLSKQRRQGKEGAEDQLVSRLAGLDIDQSWMICRAFSIFFDLANLAEDRHRVRVLRERQNAGQIRAESLTAAVLAMAKGGLDADQVQELLQALHLEPVFTAHPTEAKRRALRSALRRIRFLLSQYDTANTPERARLEASLVEELEVLWLTDHLRPRKPTVMEEVDRGLYFMTGLWKVIPRLHRDLRTALKDSYPDQKFHIPAFIRFGSWMGGDRDGNPFVTASVTAEALRRLRTQALKMHLAQARKAFNRLTQSEVRRLASANLKAALEEACWHWPRLDRRLENISVHEVHRRWLGVIGWRLRQTLKQVRLGASQEWPGAYARSTELERDLATLNESLGPSGHSVVEDWLVQTRTFGLHMAQLDVRQDASLYHAAIADLLPGTDYGTNELARASLLASHKPTIPKNPSTATAEVLSLFRLLNRTVERYGPECLGCHILSMTHSEVDLVALAWLQENLAPQVRMPLVPLFETIRDLGSGADILRRLFSLPAYRESLRQHGDRQVVMVGYSDSTKDGGYLTANWSLYRAQQQMQQAADEFSLELMLFHGRGGSLGRGGGPAARSILSLPAETTAAGLRLTEQGEVLSERYDDPLVAQRHLEQLTWALCSVRLTPPAPPNPEWVALLDRLSAQGYATYRKLVETEGFLEFFRRTTPIEGIEALQIGSRPARRGGPPTGLEGLRAIPWVFAWTQNRLIIPAWYGLGSALQSAPPELLRQMYQGWPFFQAVMDNAALALAKSDMGIAQQYAGLLERADVRETIWERLQAEHRLTVAQVLETMGSQELLSELPWLQRSIRVRNPYVDPLNLVQVEICRRLHDEDEGNEQYKALYRMTIQGIAAGLRTTG